MPVAGGLPQAVIECRARLQDGRLRLRALHDSGASGLQVCVRLSDLIDSLVLELLQAAVDELSVDKLDKNVTLVAHGGYGRRDVAPFSDVDLMLLHSPNFSQHAVPLARKLSQWIVDAGCQLGFSLRTPQQALKLAWTDATVYTSLVESRVIAGSVDLFSQLMRNLRQGAKRRSSRMIRAVEQARFEERRKYGETVFLLQPNIKRSRGGLRDIQLVRWIGFTQYGECDLDQLAQLGHLSAEDQNALKSGYQYLLRLRNQMHFEYGKSQDQLDRPLQMKLANWSGFCGAEAILPVEQFMQQYFERTSEIRYSSAHFLASAKMRSRIAQSLEHAVGLPVHRDYRIGWSHVWATRSGLERLKRDPAAVLELMSLSNKYGRPIEHNTWREIRSAMLGRPISEIDAVTIQRFWELLSHYGNLGSQLRRLQELRVLEQIIPGMKHARCLLQFNEYHKYTVDAHCIRTVECVTDLATDNSTLGNLYRELKNKTILHLALLIHDLGKGFVEDHSEVGRRIAAETADRLRLSAQDKETLMFLVHQHLLLSNTAFRHDLNSNEVIVRFASIVGSSERLILLLLMTYADLAGVGPDVVNQWKIDLLVQLYRQTDSHFRDEKPGESFRADVRDRQQNVLKLVPPSADDEWWKRQVEALPIGYLLRIPPSQIMDELAKLRNLETRPVMAWGRFSPAQQAVEYTIALKQSGKPIGTFHRITGALSSQGMQILAADIHTQPDEIVWDKFYVEDSEFEGAPPQYRIDEICATLVKALDPNNSLPPTFPKIWRNSRTKAAEGLKIQPTQVRFDNSTSDKYTIITLFAYDRMGLLYDISRVLFDLQLVLQFAKISTHLDQVVDVFYVSDLEGQKITESTRLYMIRQRLLQAVNSRVT